MDINFISIFVNIQSLVKHLLNTYFVQDMVLKHPKFVMNDGPCSQKSYYQPKLQRVTYYDDTNSSPLNLPVLFFILS